MPSIEHNNGRLREVVRSKEFQDGITEPIMAKIAGRASETSPVRTGRLKASWRYKVNADGGTLYNTAPYSFWVEKGNSKGAPAQHIALNATLDVLRGMK